MYIEIETKLKVEFFDDIIERLTQLGAEFVTDQSQQDFYYDDTDANMAKSDRALRLRRQINAQNEKIILTYKGPKQPSNLKKRQEIETEVVDLDSAEKILAALGYNRALVVQKKRSIWQLGDCEVALDEVSSLGSFVEIEGPDNKKITDVQQRLGLADLPHIKESYACLLTEKLRAKESEP